MALLGGPVIAGGGPPPPPPARPPPPLPPVLAEDDNYDVSSGESDVGDIEPAATGIIVAASPAIDSDADADDNDDDADPGAGQRAARPFFGEQIGPASRGLTWQYGRHFGTGTFGTAHLWVSANGTNKIARRIVVKDA